MLSKFLVLVVALMAAFLVWMRFADILQLSRRRSRWRRLATFPALVLGIFWRRANRTGAVLGMVAGCWCACSTW